MRLIYTSRVKILANNLNKYNAATLIALVNKYLLHIDHI